jgi:hypothetical protein
MLAPLLALAGLLAARGALTNATAPELAADVFEVATSEPPLFDGADAREKTARLLLVWAARESAGQIAALGDCAPGKRTLATCRSFGAMQMDRGWLAALELAPADVLADRRLALRSGLDVFRRLRDKCGGVRAGLRAYASGTCAGSPRARALVEWRCKEAGAC